MPTAPADTHTRARLGLLLLLVGLLYLARAILLPFVAAAVLAYVFDAVVSRVQRRLRLPRAAAIGLCYLLTLGPLAAAIVALEPGLVADTRALLDNAPRIVADLMVGLFGSPSVEIFDQTITADDVAGSLADAVLEWLGSPAEALVAARLAVELLAGSLLTLVLLFYFLLNGERFGAYLLWLVPEPHRARVVETAGDVHEVLGRYLRGLLVLVLLMATVTWTGLTLIFGLPFALPLALATGLLEIIPIVGPVAAATVAAMVGLSHGGAGMAAGVLLFYTVARQLEDHLVMPIVVGRVVQLHPVVVIFAVLAGGVLAGIPGMLLAVPTAATLKIVVETWILETPPEGSPRGVQI
ncbi:MAG: AI-2E family transporter [Chloroflexi bacterium]|nr:AI-2E family transporter [Chloroflexota bacterium]